MTGGFAGMANKIINHSILSQIKIMTLYYLPCLIRSDRYFITRLDQDIKQKPDFDFCDTCCRKGAYTCS